jgi:3-methylcrotonyl-CoA carboxylase alpha subunit
MFLPSPGKLARFALPAATEGVRIDTGVREGDTITAYYDPMVAKLICHGATRDEALARMAAVLEGTTVEGIFTNVEFLRRVVAHAAFQRGEVFTGFIDAYKADLLA